MAKMSGFSRLQEEHQKALHERQEQLRTWEKFKADYEALNKRLGTLPGKVSHEVMVPFGSVAFMPGKLIHTNEILVLLGDNWFVERSAAQAQQIVQRRIGYVNQHIIGVQEDLKGFESRLEYSKELAPEDGSGLVDIREHVTLEQEQQSSNRRIRKAHRGSTTIGPKRVHGLRKDVKPEVQATPRNVSTEDAALFARLDELEVQEQKWNELSDDESNLESDSSQFTNRQETLNELNKDFVAQGEGKADGKHVHWKDSSDESDGDSASCRAIPVIFTPASNSALKQTTAESSPADIYNMIPEKDPTVLPVDADLKPILKTHSPGDKQNVVPPVQQPPTDQATMVTKGPQAGFEPHKAFYGQVIEKSADTQSQEQITNSQASAPGTKRVSKFKAARQKTR